MKLFSRLLALFLILPIVELALLVQVDKLIGFWPTIGLIIGTGFLGTYLAKREGLGAWRRFNERLAHGGLPGRELIDGVIILVCAALLITPGVLTDVIGFLGLLPPTRALFRRLILRRVQRASAEGRLAVFGFGPASPWEDGGDAHGPQWQGSAREVPLYGERREDGA